MTNQPNPANAMPMPTPRHARVVAPEYRASETTAKEIAMLVDSYLHDAYREGMSYEQYVDTYLDGVLTPIAEHWEPMSGGYRQSLVRDTASGRVSAIRFEYGNPASEGVPVEWYETFDLNTTYLATVPLDALAVNAYPNEGEWMEAEGAYPSAPRVGYRNTETQVAVETSNGWELYSIN